MKQKSNEDMYELYEEYRKSRKLAMKGRNKRQKMNKYIREKYDEPYKRKDYNKNKNDITNWNSMIRELEEGMKEMEMYLDFEDRYFLHKEYNNVKSMILNQNSYEGEVPLDNLFGESIPDTTEIVCNVELQEEITELLDRALTKRQREVIHMYFWDGMTQEKIGNKLGVSRQAISETLSKSLEILGDICSERYLEYLT